MKKTNIILIVFVFIATSVISVFFGNEFINPFSMDAISREILFSLRIPRVMVAILMGFSLGATGAILQGMLRNPLADPYILGISSGAALFVGIAIASDVIILNFVTLPLFAFIGAGITSLMVGILGYKRGVVLPERLLLAGIGLGFFFTALLMFIISVSSDLSRRSVLLWIFGDLSMADFSLLPYGFLLILIGFTLSMWRGKALNSLMLGDEIAHTLGFSPSKERGILFIAVSLMTATSVSLGGVVGFVGLLMPHIVRFFIGSDSRFLIPLSAICGALVLTLADTIGRTVISPIEIPAGIIVSVIGAPYFLYLLKRKEVMGAL